MYDAVVVGAGFAGLTAARELVRLGYDVLVLEGRGRVGGRSWGSTLAGAPIDLGASFVGPGQDAVRTLAAELGCATAPIYNDGTNLIRWRGRVRPYRGAIPRLSAMGLLDIARLRWQFQRIARRVPLAEPWTTPGAQRLDAQSLGGWLTSVYATSSSRDLMAIMSRVVWGCEPDEVSMLHAARYVKAAGGLDRLLDVEGGAQQDHFAAGSHEIALKAAGELGSRVVLEAVVRRIEWNDSTVALTSTGGTVTARCAILAIPPAHRAGIDFVPPLPAGHREIPARWPQGALTKAYAAYDTPFWRANGHTGQAMSDEGPVFITFDAGHGDDGPGILLGFVDARAFDALPATERRRQALACFAALFGDDALHPIDYADQRWGAEEFAPGGPTAAVPPGSWTSCGAWLRTPVGPIHWAGTETADEWTGFLDGAVRSGQRAAAEVAQRLQAPA